MSRHCGADQCTMWCGGGVIYYALCIPILMLMLMLILVHMQADENTILREKLLYHLFVVVVKTHIPIDMQKHKMTTFYK